MKVAIYTVLTGNYDNLKQPKVINSNFDFFCFSNDIPKESIGVWKICKIPGTYATKQLESRYPKMHPWEFFTDYQYSVYMDANIQICNEEFYQRIISKIESGRILSGIKHPFRDCPYNEGYVVFTYNLERFWTVVKTMRFLKAEGFPRHYGMFEANVILRKHHNERIKKQCCLWWDLFNKFSKRDQLTYSYTLWKTGIPFDYLLPEKMSARNYPSVAFQSHIRQKNIWGTKLLRIGRFFYRKICGFHS